MVDDEKPMVAEKAKYATRGVRAAIQASPMRGYGVDERRQLREGRGPKLGRKPGELFLRSKLMVHISRYQVFEVVAGAPSGGSKSSARPVQILMNFPPVCAGCLEPTDRVDDRPREFSFGEASTPTMTQTITVTAQWPVPLCERCMGYQLDALFQLEAGRVGLSGMDYVRFRFPNLAYADPFCRANGRSIDQVDSIFAPMSDSIVSIVREHGVIERTRQELAECLDAWSAVRDGLGFHRYAKLKHRLLDMGSSATKDSLAALAEEFDISPDQLREVERIATQPIEALRALDA
jgi:hypothetical protein